MEITLVIMAAGIASRFGGSKQTAGMGPNGETLLEYAAFDAARAGFDRVVFVIRPQMRAVMEELAARSAARWMQVDYAPQDFSSLPAWYAAPGAREKPFGTVHAVLCARERVRAPFAVINADDYYGPGAFAEMVRFLAQPGDASEAAMVGYRLRHTVSRHGTVTRGICRMRDGMLSQVEEVQKVRLYPDGRIADTSRGEPGEELNPDALVSMNFWGFRPGVFDVLQARFEAFLRGLEPGDVRGEYPLPTFVGDALRAGELSVRVLETDAEWFGVTYQEDRPMVQQALLELHRRGVYGEAL